VPATTLSIADLPGGAMECFAVSPSSLRKPPAIVAIRGE